MELFAVFRQGVYRHECAGIFSSAEGAIAAAIHVIGLERDCYHEYQVVPFVLNVTASADKEWPDDMFVPAEADPLYQISRDKSGAITTVRINPHGVVSVAPPATGGER